MTELKCPYCQQPIVCMDAQDADEHSTWYCPRCIAEKAWYAFGNDKLWQALIDTKKKLDIAVDALKYLYTETKGNHYRIPDLVVLSKALEQIKDKEQQ